MLHQTLDDDISSAALASLEQKLGFVIPADVGDSEVTDVEGASEEEDAVDFVVSVVLGEVEDEVDISSATVVIVTVLEVSVQTKLIYEINDYRYGLPPRSWKVSG